jgi:hypothetical protein
MSILDFYHRLARRLAPLRPLLWAAMLSCMAIFVTMLFMTGAPRESAIALGAITALVWILLLLAVAHAFAAPLPQALPQARLAARLRVQLRRGLLWLVAAAMTALAGAVTLFSLRALGTLLG